MTATREHLAGLELAHKTIAPYSSWCAGQLRKLIDQAQSTTEPVHGEAVEVVGYGCAGQIEVLKHVPLTGAMKVSGCSREKYSVPLMTVAQHNRIMAAFCAGQGEAVAEITEDAMGFLGAQLIKGPKPCVYHQRLHAGTKLYTAAAKPDAEHLRDPTKMVDAELVELIEFVRAKIRSAGRCHPNAVEYLLAEALEAVDAKLASLKGERNDDMPKPD